MFLLCLYVKHLVHVTSLLYGILRLRLRKFLKKVEKILEKFSGRMILDDVFGEHKKPKCSSAPVSQHPTAETKRWVRELSTCSSLPTFPGCSNNTQIPVAPSVYHLFPPSVNWSEEEGKAERERRWSRWCPSDQLQPCIINEHKSLMLFAAHR